MKKIPLGRKLFAIVDDDDYCELMKFKWSALYSKNNRYSYPVRQPHRGTFVYMHKQIMGFPDHKVDHIDHNVFNNSKSNLRPATHSQNIANQSRLRKSNSGFKGVKKQILKCKRQWIARIRCRSRDFYLGSYITKEEAAKAYDSAAVRMFGEFAVLNFPSPPSQPTTPFFRSGRPSS